MTSHAWSHIGAAIAARRLTWRKPAPAPRAEADRDLRSLALAAIPAAELSLEQSTCRPWSRAAAAVPRAAAPARHAAMRARQAPALAEQRHGRDFGRTT